VPKDIPESTKVALYQSADGKVTVDVRFERETFWLTQKSLAGLFDVKVPAINKHLKNIYASGELTPEGTISKMETVQTEGKRAVVRTVDYYNLDAAIAVGYRVNSAKATHFRIWAKNTLREVMTMKDWLAQVKRFLDFNEQQALTHAGKISREMAVARAHEEFEKFRVKQDQDYFSDFDEKFERYLKGGNEK